MVNQMVNNMKKKQEKNKFKKIQKEKSSSLNPKTWETLEQNMKLFEKFDIEPQKFSYKSGLSL